MSKIRKLFAVFLATAAMLLSSMPSEAQNLTAKTDPTDYFGGAGTAVSTNLAYFIAPARGSARAGINFLSFSSDSSGAKFKVYPITTSTLVTNAIAAPLTNILVALTNGFAVGDVIIIRSVANDTYQRALVGPTISAAGFVITNDLSAATLSFSLVAGDVIYRCGTPASITTGATVTSWSANGPGPALVSGVSQPLLVEVNAAVVTVLATNNGIVAGGKFLR